MGWAFRRVRAHVVTALLTVGGMSTVFQCCVLMPGMVRPPRDVTSKLMKRDDLSVTKLRYSLLIGMKCLQAQPTLNCSLRA